MKFKFLIVITFLVSSSLTAQNGIVKGKVFDANNNDPISFANVVIQGTTIGVSTDIDGNYILDNLKPGLVNLTVSYLGYKELTKLEIEVSNSKPSIVDFALEEAAEELGEIVVKASPFVKKEESPVSLRSIGTSEIKRNPGGGRDISRVVQSLPGVTTTASFRNDLLIRGGAPNENRFYLDDVEVPNINHFATQGASGGPVGLINVDFIREVDFFSGAFPANRGNSLSSVFNFKQKNGRDDRIGATMTLGSSDLALTLEGPLTKDKKTTFLFSGRQSYLQFLFQAIGLPFLPTYNDFQVKIRSRPNDKNEFYFVGLGALDQFKLNLEANETETQKYLLANLPVSPQWNYTNGFVYKRYTENSYWTFVLSRNMLNNRSFKYRDNDDSSADNLIFDYTSQEIENKVRIENTLRSGGYKVNFGVGYEYVKYNNSTFSKIVTPFGEETIDFSSEFDMHKYAAFGQVSKSYFKDKLALSFGVRIDGNSYSDLMNNPLKQFSPRLSASFAVTPQLSLNVNSGIYYQLPAYTILGYRDEADDLVNKKETVYTKNRHFVAGIEYSTLSNSRLSIEGYFKDYSNYPFLLRDSLTLANVGSDFGVVGNEPIVANKRGRTYGLEFLFQQKLYKGFYGILAYTLGFSEFEDKNGNFVPSSWDSRHIVNVTLGKQFPKNWEVGARFRLQTGLPYTPFNIEQSALRASWDIYGRGLPDYNLLNTERGQISNQLDLRVDKKWFFKKWSLNLYLDVQNVYASTVGNDILLLDRDVDGNPILENEGQFNESYKLKTVNDATGNALPTIGIILEY